MKFHNLAVVGGGSRGRHMAKLALRKPGRVKIVAVVEINDTRRILFQEEFELPKSCCFKNYKELLENKIEPDGVFVTTLPNSHAEIACAFLEEGIPVFLEKPMATSIEDAGKIVNAARKTGTAIQVGFNCRYAPFFEKIKSIVSSGQLGKILSLEWKEVLTPYHWSTYNWHSSYNRREVIGSWLLEKCCHDLDLINWLVESCCVRVASFGNRVNFSLPPMEVSSEVIKRFPELKKDLKGRKIEWESYKNRADLVDHQSCILEYENGITACFSLVPLGRENTRLVYICGTEATLKGSWESDQIRIFPYNKGAEEIARDPDESIKEEHGGGDSRIVSAFLDYLDDPANKPKTTVDEGWESMVVGCGIDISMKEHRVVELDTLRNMMEQI